MKSMLDTKNQGLKIGNIPSPSCLYYVLFMLWEVLTLVISEIRIVLTPPLLVKIRDQITYLQDNVFIIQDLI